MSVRTMPPIDTLPAGPALDELVIREVMQWPSVAPRLTGPYPHVCLWTMGAVRCWGLYLDGGLGQVFAPSTEWKSAGLVVERFWAVHMSACAGTIPRYTVTITARSGGPQYQAGGETFPLALCRVALKAVRGEREQGGEQP